MAQQNKRKAVVNPNRLYHLREKMNTMKVLRMKMPMTRIIMKRITKKHKNHLSHKEGRQKSRKDSVKYRSMEKMKIISWMRRETFTT